RGARLLGKMRDAFTLRRRPFFGERRCDIMRVFDVANPGGRRKVCRSSLAECVLQERRFAVARKPGRNRCTFQLNLCFYSNNTERAVRHYDLVAIDDLVQFASLAILARLAIGGQLRGNTKHLRELLRWLTKLVSASG